MNFVVRPTAATERRAAADVFRSALLYAPVTDDEFAKPDFAESWGDGRSLTAWHGDRCIGHAGAFDFEVAVPGGARLPMAGVTRVGVLQTHRRKGALTALLNRLLLDAAEGGAAIATLRASEGVIYGRFGFQVGGEVLDVEIDRRSGAHVAAPVAAGSLRLLARDEIISTISPLHDRVGFDRPGTVSRTGWLHRRYLADALAPDKAAHVLVHRSVDGVDDGYAAFALEWPEAFGESHGGICSVGDVWAASAAVELALWKFVLELDLVHTVRAEERPLDDPLRFALSNQRHFIVKARYDEQWVRLLDVNRALDARTYQPMQGAVTIAVTDPIFSVNNGTWRVSADGAAKAAIDPADADVRCAINGISGAYFGGVSWYELANGGLATEQRDGAIADADRLFAARPQPRCGSFF